MKAFGILITLILFAQMKVNAATELEVKLQQFHQDPATFLNTLPMMEVDERKFSHREILEGTYIDGKNTVRDQIVRESDPSGPGYNDRVESLFRGETLMTTLHEMDELKLTSGKVKVMPWSDDYWPIFQGILGKRYEDNNFAYKED